MDLVIILLLRVKHTFRVCTAKRLKSGSVVMKENRVTVVATCWEVLVVVLVTSFAFSLAKLGISLLWLRETDFVGSHWWWWQDYKTRDTGKLEHWLNYVSSLNSTNASRWESGQVSFVVTLWLDAACGWPAQQLVVVVCFATPTSLTMTYPSRVYLASSFLFSSRSSGMRKRSGGLLQPIVLVPHRQSLLPAPLNTNPRWRSHRA